LLWKFSFYSKKGTFTEKKNAIAEGKYKGEVKNRKPDGFGVE
jgi:hypothetical protein